MLRDLRVCSMWENIVNLTLTKLGIPRKHPVRVTTSNGRELLRVPDDCGFFCPIKCSELSAIDKKGSRGSGYVHLMFFQQYILNNKKPISQKLKNAEAMSY